MQDNNPHTAGKYAIIVALITGGFTVLGLLLSHILSKNQNNDESIIPNSSTIEKTKQYSMSIGSQNYKVVKANGLIWMAENLNYQIPDSWCYENDSKNCVTYGRLYTWEAAKRVCKELGWRLPTDAEFKQLAFSHGGYSYIDSIISWDWDGNRSYVAGEVGDNINKAYRDLIVGGSSGFDAQLGGVYEKGEFDILSERGLYWTDSSFNSDSIIIIYEFKPFGNEIERTIGLKSYGLSCRCVKEY